MDSNPFLFLREQGQHCITTQVVKAESGSKPGLLTTMYNQSPVGSVGRLWNLLGVLVYLHLLRAKTNPSGIWSVQWKKLTKGPHPCRGQCDPVSWTMRGVVCSLCTWDGVLSQLWVLSIQTRSLQSSFSVFMNDLTILRENGAAWVRNTYYFLCF